MYFTILEPIIKPQFSDICQTKIFLKTFPEIEEIHYEYTSQICYYISLRNIRKIKILSLHDKNIKSNWNKLENILYDKTKIHIYGDEKPNLYSSTSGISGSAGTNGNYGMAKLNLYNRFVSKPKKNFDFHKIKTKYKVRN